tara:strand:- start:51 stop:680 length:630 start_codon:yes stop_codon:yes gene_type:complete
VSLLVGLTGGIGSGKSLAGKIFEELGAHVLDADQLCRDLVLPGQVALKEIVQSFGKKILDSRGNLDRKKLAKLVFQNNEKKVILEGILHSKVFEIEQKEYLKIKANDTFAIVIINSALMIESGNYRNMDKLIVVHSSEEAQIQRILRRSGMSYDEAMVRIKSQMPVHKKIRYADFILENNSLPQDLKKKIQELYPQLVEFSLKAENPKS